jgi:hypothetical protein
MTNQVNLEAQVASLKVSKAVSERINTLFTEGKVSTVKVTGSGWRTSYRVYTFEVQTALNALGVKYTVGNDSPRGGKGGEFIQLINN